MVQTQVLTTKYKLLANMLALNASNNRSCSQHLKNVYINIYLI